jgi:hypothetical protein
MTPIAFRYIACALAIRGYIRSGMWMLGANKANVTATLKSAGITPSGDWEGDAKKVEGHGLRYGLTAEAVAFLRSVPDHAAEFGGVAPYDQEEVTEEWVAMVTPLLNEGLITAEQRDDDGCGEVITTWIAMTPRGMVALQ